MSEDEYKKLKAKADQNLDNPSRYVWKLIKRDIEKQKIKGFGNHE